MASFEKKASCSDRCLAVDKNPTQMLTPEEEARVRAVFLKLDENNDGVLDRLELILGLIDLEHPEPTLATVEEMLKSVGMAGQKECSLSEFKIIWKNEGKWSWGRHVGKLLSNLSFSVGSMLGAAAEEEYVDADEAPRGVPSHDAVATFYDLQEEVGSGAYSTVFRAVEKKSGQAYALKRVSKESVNSKEDVDSLFEEVGILQQIHHVHIMSLHAFYEDENSYSIVTELVEGGELFDRVVALQHYSEKEARDLCQVMLKTLHFLHSNNIVHRDLKPENILLANKEDNCHIKIADFGFAKHLSERLDTVCGTPDYIAPEVCALLDMKKVPRHKRPAYTEKCDIWSAGIIFYILLAGYPPFFDDDRRALFRKIRSGRFEFHSEYWGSVSTEAKDLISKMLIVDPRKRPSAGQLLLHPWMYHQDDVLSSKKLDTAKLKSTIARRRLKAAADSIIAVRRLSTITSGHR